MLHQYEVNNMKIYTLSSLIDNHQLFCKFAQDAYSATDCLCQDYPKYFEWYWSKNFPRVFNGTGEIVVCIIDDNIAGIASLKKINTEKKICTFFVVKEYRGQHVATKMLEYIFEYLGTSKPLITITDYKVLSFVPIIKKYNWKLTQITSKGYITTMPLVSLCTMAGFLNDSSQKNTLRNSSEFQVCFFLFLNHLSSLLQSHLFSYFFLLFGLVLLSYHLLKLFLVLLL